MTSSRNRKSSGKNLPPREYQRRYNAARAAAQRLYCDAFGFWRACACAPCRRAKRCCGNAGNCLAHGVARVPPSRRNRAYAWVMAGGPRRIPATTPMERMLRGYPLSSLC
jgi:hypothetical protein